MLKVVFLAIGALMLAIALLPVLEARAFLRDSARAEGTVVALAESRAGKSTMYGPVVRFTVPAGAWMRRRDALLRAHGRPVETEFQCAELNLTMRVGNQHPWRVLTRWQDPETAREHVFRSRNVWFDPTRLIGSRKITVFIDRRNPGRYLVDLSFLPGQ